MAGGGVTMEVTEVKGERSNQSDLCDIPDPLRTQEADENHCTRTPDLEEGLAHTHTLTTSPHTHLGQSFSEAPPPSVVRLPRDSSLRKKKAAHLNDIIHRLEKAASKEGTQDQECDA